MNCIELNNVSVKFRLYHEKVFTLKERVISALKKKYTYEDFYAIKDLSLNVAKGDTLGIVGENGSGKSTLLKLICRVLRPSAGTVTVEGSISPLLELGAGFDHELTGRENIFLNGSLMGFSKKEMQKKFEHIVEFSGLSNFIDTPVKNYSSGMYMRLGFSIAVDVDPDILLIDEILAVGDASFQKKCFAKINEFKEQGKTIIIVSHNNDFIMSFCNKALWIAGGKAISIGPAGDTIAQYIEYMDKKDQEDQQIQSIQPPPPAPEPPPPAPEPPPPAPEPPPPAPEPPPPAPEPPPPTPEPPPPTPEPPPPTPEPPPPTPEPPDQPEQPAQPEQPDQPEQPE